MKKQPATPDKPLVAVAKAVGSAAGTVAGIVDAEVAQLKKVSLKVSGRFVKKDKSRLPRKEKKAAQKAADRK